jgi:hypothetical protein
VDTRLAGVATAGSSGVRSVAGREVFEQELDEASPAKNSSLPPLAKT